MCQSAGKASRFRHANWRVRVELRVVVLKRRTIIKHLGLFAFAKYAEQTLHRNRTGSIVAREYSLSDAQYG